MSSIFNVSSAGTVESQKKAHETKKTECLCITFRVNLSKNKPVMKNSVGGPALLNFETYYKVLVGSPGGSVA